jgi:hypothetical protein
MRVAAKSWWFLPGVICLPYLVLVLLLTCYQLIDLDLRTWLWASVAISVGAGAVCIWRLPIHWFLRLDATLIYVPCIGYSLVCAADRFAANLS